MHLKTASTKRGQSCPMELFSSPKFLTTSLTKLPGLCDDFLRYVRFTFVLSKLNKVIGMQGI